MVPHPVSGRVQVMMVTGLMASKSLVGIEEKMCKTVVYRGRMQWYLTTAVRMTQPVDDLWLAVLCVQVWGMAWAEHTARTTIMKGNGVLVVSQAIAQGTYTSCLNRRGLGLLSMRCMSQAATAICHIQDEQQLQTLTCTTQCRQLLQRITGREAIVVY